MKYLCPFCSREMDTLVINGKEIEAVEAAECHCCTDPATGDTRKFAAISFQGKNYWQELLDYETEKEL